MFAYDLHAIGVWGSGFSVRVGGRGAHRSITSGLLWGAGVASPHEVAAFASDAFDIDIDILIWLRLDEFRSHLQDVRVERPGEALVSSDYDQQDIFLRPLGEQGMDWQAGDRIVDIGSRHERFKNTGEHLRIRTRG